MDMSTGGYLNNKFERPFSPHHALHLTMRTPFACLRSPSMLKWLSAFIPEKARGFRIRLFHFAIVNNHLHLLILAPDRRALTGFLRVVTGVIARKALGAERGRKQNQKMWVSRPYSRVLSWGREFTNVLKYIERNVLEAMGRISYVARDRRLDDLVKRRIDLSLTPQLTLRI